MRHYQKINLICGWSVFAVAALVYALTVEPSASFWDCPEFILSGAKLEVGHPPGAPFFMLAANLFSHLASDVSQIAYLVNLMNALLSAGCILFLFWSVTYLTRRLLIGDDKMEKVAPWQVITLMGSGAVAAFAYMFSDTFWFSAVEGEVYAFSSFFTALAFWIMLRWDEEAGSVSSDRWIVLLAYIIGLSIGVHLLNLLCIPAVGWLFYYRKWQHTTLKGTILSMLVSMLIVAVVLYGIVPGVMKVAGYFELVAVNQLGMSYNSGMLAYYLLLLVVLCWGVYETAAGKQVTRMITSFLSGCLLVGITCQGDTRVALALSFVFLLFGFWILYRLFVRFRETMRRVLHVISLCLLVIVLGYSSYALILIRSAANTPMDQQSPEDPFTLKDYLGREQYGDTPLLYGPTFQSPRAFKEVDGYLMYDYKEGEPQYRRQNWTGDSLPDKYVSIGNKISLRYQPETCVWFPRMYSSLHAAAYQSWMGETMEEKSVSYYDARSGQTQTVAIPSAWDNLRYFFSYQLNYMYWRYFLWNFVGRQNDIQGFGDPEHGNWITGFSFIDRFLVGDQDLLPDSLKNNKGRNVYYALPLLLGILGMCWQIRRGRHGTRQFNIILMLFLMTGIAVVLYLNQPPQQPRERDYAYAVSFYAFSIWIGMGVAGLVQWSRRYLSSTKASVLAVAVALCIPFQMGSQTWDDHDRSGRYVCRDVGQNYLSTLPEKGYPIILVNGDNDTFPLWYNCEVEGFRTDARACNLTYLISGWYVDQMVRPAYSSPGFPLSIPRAYYRDGINDAVAVNPVVRRDRDSDGEIREHRLKDEIEALYKKNPEEKPFGDDPFEWNNIVKYWLTSPDESMRCIPTDEIHIKVDREAVVRSGMTLPEGTEIPDTMVISLKGRGTLTRSGLVLLDLIRQCNWERPLYVAATVGKDEFIDLSDYLVQEGLAYRIVPYNVRKAKFALDTDKMYTHVMKNYKYGGMGQSVYLDETNVRMVLTLQRSLVELAEKLYQQGDSVRSKNVLDLCDEKITQPDVVGNKYSSTSKMGILYGLLGENEKGYELWKKAYQNFEQYALWYHSISGRQFSAYPDSYLQTLFAMHTMLQEAMQAGLLQERSLSVGYLLHLEKAYNKLRDAGYTSHATLVGEWISAYKGTKK